MLEAAILSGKVTPSAVIATDTTNPKAGGTLTVTVNVKGLTDTDVIYWAIADGQELLASDFATNSGSGRTTNKRWTITVTMPYKSVNTGKKFRIGVGQTLAEARAGVMGLSGLITMGAGNAVSGSQNWTTGGTYYLTVPEFVYSMAVYGASAGGGGGDGENKYGGKAGTPGKAGVAGNSSFAVTPGERITIVVGAGGTNVKGQNGGKGGDTTVTRASGTRVLNLVGGDGGTYMGGSGGGDGGKPTAAGSGVSVTGVSVTPLPGTPGAGGFGGSVSYKQSTAGSPGAVRLVW